jgi:hypothetical protein
MQQIVGKTFLIILMLLGEAMPCWAWGDEGHMIIAVAGYAAQMGCKVDANVTKRTTILVVGEQDLGQLAGHRKSNKHRKAEELIRKGHSHFARNRLP